jgi:hypothetical protein
MRSKNNIFRLTELQLEQLEQHLEKEQTTFTVFILSLIQSEIMKDAVRHIILKILLAYQIAHV